MKGISTFNQLFLAANPDIAKKVKKEYEASHPKVYVMALKPKYAKMIYEGRKNWEFRKAPPPLFKGIYIYESAPVSKVTGVLYFTESFTALPETVLDFVKRNKIYTENKPGITYDELLDYAGKDLVTALRVFKPERLEHPIELSGKPPQNWGKYRAQLRHPEGGAN